MVADLFYMTCENIFLPIYFNFSRYTKLTIRSIPVEILIKTKANIVLRLMLKYWTFKFGSYDIDYSKTDLTQ